MNYKMSYIDGLDALPPLLYMHRIDQELYFMIKESVVIIHQIVCTYTELFY